MSVTDFIVATTKGAISSIDDVPERTTKEVRKGKADQIRKLRKLFNGYRPVAVNPAPVKQYIPKRAVVSTTGHRWDDYIQAAKALGVRPGSITSAIEREHRCRGLRLEYAEGR